MNSKTKRIAYFDVLRTIACVAVVMIHICDGYAEGEVGTLNFWVGNVLDSLSRIAVPIFVMISGALMLDEDYEFTAEKLKKHLVKMLVFFLTWSAFYALFFYVFNPLISSRPISIGSVIAAFIEGNYHLWFIYMITGLYLILPILRLFVKKCNKKYIEYFLLLSLIFTFLLPQIASVGMYFSPAFKVLHEVLNTLNLKFVGGYVTYFILGWYINNFGLKDKNTIYLLGIVGYIITVGGAFLFGALFKANAFFYNNLYLNVLACAVAVFLFVKSAVKEKEKGGVTAFIAKHSLGIYAIHAFFLSIVFKALKVAGINNALIVIPVSFVAVFGISLFASFIMSKIPLLKKIV